MFHNELFIDPIKGADGIVTHFVGCQNAIETANSAYLRDQAIERLGRLTPRESEVFELLANGYNNRNIAAMLNIGIRTAEKHGSRVMNKLEASNVTQIVRYAIALSVPFTAASTPSFDDEPPTFGSSL